MHRALPQPGVAAMPGLAVRRQREDEDALVARGELAVRGLAKDDGFPGQVEGVGREHAVAADFFARDEEEGDGVRGGGGGAEEGVEGEELRGDAGFGVDGAAAVDVGGGVQGVVVEGGDGVEVGG